MNEMSQFTGTQPIPILNPTSPVNFHFRNRKSFGGISHSGSQLGASESLLQKINIHLRSELEEKTEELRVQSINMKKVVMDSQKLQLVHSQLEYDHKLLTKENNNRLKELKKMKKALTETQAKLWELQMHSK